MEMGESVPVMRLQFDELSYAVPQRRKEKKQILKSVSGEFRSGELTAIMGPSGAGKTTLMSVLAGFKVSSATGDILVNDEIRNLTDFQKSSCLITQRDELCPVLTVMEYMQYAVDLKIGDHLCIQRKKQLIEDILKTIGISHCCDTRAANLSGGEKKRLAISLELISNPQFMFFDEPTSGLDSMTCFQCVSILKRLAQEGRAIICVIHQPSSSIFEMFDQLYLLADGQCIYQGPTANVLNSIENTTGVVCPLYHSPADFAIDVAIRQYGSEAVDKLLEQNKKDKFGQLSKNFESKSIQNENSSVEYENGWEQNAMEQFSNRLKIHDDTGPMQYNVARWTQFCVIFKKSSTCILRDQVLTKTRGIAQLVFAFLTGIIYMGIGDESSQVLNNFKLIFFTHLGIVAISMMAIVFTFPIERKVLLREHTNRWFRLDVYYLAKMLADFPLEIVNTSVFVTIIYLMSNQPPDAERFFKFLGLGVMSGLVAQSLGTALGAALSLQAAVFIGPPTVIPFGLFAGALIRFQEIPSYMQWICSISFMRYGFVGKMISVYDIHRPPLQCSEEFCYFKAPTKILQWLFMDNDVYWVDLTAMFGFFFLIRGLAYFILLWKLKSKM